MYNGQVGKTASTSTWTGLGYVSLRFLNPLESESGFSVSLLNRSIQDFSDHGATKEPKSPLWEWILPFLWHTMIEEILDSVNLFGKETQNPFSDLSDLRIQSWIFFKKNGPLVYTLFQSMLFTVLILSNLYLVCLHVITILIGKPTKNATYIQAIKH